MLSYWAMGLTLDRQLSLLPRNQFPHPTAHGVTHYVPVLKTLPGEMRALAELPPVSWARLTPLVEVNTRGGETDEPPHASALPSLPSKFASMFRERTFFLDFPWLTSGKKVTLGQGRERRTAPAIEYVTKRCYELGLNFIPVISPASDARLTSLVREVASEGRGACIRLPVSRAFASAKLQDLLDPLLNKVGVEPRLADIVVDLEYIDPDPGYDARDLRRFFESLPLIMEWRSLVVVGTVMPKTLAQFQKETITPLRRHEWHLWNELRAFDLPRAPTFGDYGIQHPKRPMGKGWRMRANIRYSTPETFLIARGRSLEEFGREEYRRLCEALLDRPEFRSGDYSWGDNEIVRCAAGLDDPGTQLKWRGAGTSHHLQVMVEALAPIAA